MFWLFDTLNLKPHSLLIAYKKDNKQESNQ
jgi:hypothetical protein